MLKKHKINLFWFLSGIFLLLLGFIILMIDPSDKSMPQSVYAWHKITLAPVMLVSGYISCALSIICIKRNN